MHLTLTPEAAAYLGRWKEEVELAKHGSWVESFRWEVVPRPQPRDRAHNGRSLLWYEVVDALGETLRSFNASPFFLSRFFAFEIERAHFFSLESFISRFLQLLGPIGLPCNPLINTAFGPLLHEHSWSVVEGHTGNFAIVNHLNCSSPTESVVLLGCSSLLAVTHFAKQHNDDLELLAKSWAAQI